MRALVVVLLLTGCAVPSPMGALVYCPQDHVCKQEVAPPAQAASAPLRDLLRHHQP